MLVAFVGLKERCKISELVALLLDVAGVVLTCSSSILAVGTEASESNSALLTTLGCTFAAISGVIFYPCGAVLTRTIDSNLRVGVIMLLNGLLGIFITIPVVYFTAEEPVTQTLGETPSLYGYVSGACLFYVMYLWSYNRSLQLEKAGRVATLVTVVVVVNYFTQLLIFHYVAQWWEIVGVVLVLLSSFLITAVVWREKDEFFIPNGVLADCSCNIHCLD
ncbi:solute carrier family 35 member G1-like [Ptychodera flava]|uniref:solute carrier family 35 member G1-like n=1 Tax=Ptychodera flava TaxID=63121 RepID=UPI00396A9509